MKTLAGVLLLSAVAWGADAPKRVFLGDHENFQQASSLVQTATTGAGRAEQTKTLMKACPSIVITGDRDKADFLVQWDSKTWQQTSWGGHENEFTIYNSAKDVVGTGSAHHMKNAAADICKMISGQQK